MAAVMRRLPLRAGQLGGAAERLRESFAGRALPVERRLAQVELDRARHEVGDVDWEAAWTSGRAFRQDEAIALALALPEVREGGSPLR
jgi:hypothetical protein